MLTLTITKLLLCYYANYFFVNKDEFYLENLILELIWLIFLPYFLLNNIITSLVIIFTIFQFAYIYLISTSEYNFSFAINKFFVISLSFSILYYSLSIISIYLILPIFIFFQLVFQTIGFLDR